MAGSSRKCLGWEECLPPSPLLLISLLWWGWYQEIICRQQQSIKIATLLYVFCVFLYCVKVFFLLLCFLPTLTAEWMKRHHCVTNSRWPISHCSSQKTNFHWKIRRFEASRQITTGGGGGEWSDYNHKWKRGLLLLLLLLILELAGACYCKVFLGLPSS